jgi:hypothetical protein
MFYTSLPEGKNRHFTHLNPAKNSALKFLGKVSLTITAVACPNAA